MTVGPVALACGEAAPSGRRKCLEQTAHLVARKQNSRFFFFSFCHALNFVYCV